MLVRRAPQGAGVRLGAAGATLLGTTSEIDYVPADEVDLMDVSPKQIVSVATAMIPFLEHDDANRALMGANMQKQAVPLVRAEAPYIGTGVEARAARDAGDVIMAEGDGEVSEVTGDHITVEYQSGTRTTSATRSTSASTGCSSSARSNQGTCINQKPLVERGRPGRAGLGAGRRSVHPPGRPRPRQEPARRVHALGGLQLRGRHHPLASAWSSDDVLTSIHIEAHEVDARDTKLGAEEITRDIPNLSEEILKDLDERGIIRIGAEVGPGDVLVGKVTPKGETELTPEERLLRAIFGEKAREVRDTSLKVPHGETGKVIDVKVFSRDEQHELAPGVNQLVRVYVAQKRKISEGDKLAGRHGNKGVISKILPVEDMPLPGRRHARRHHPQPPRRAEPHERRPGARGPPRVRGPLGLGWATSRCRASAVRGTENKTRTITDPAVWVSTPVFDGAHWDEVADAGRNPTIKQHLRDPAPRSRPTAND